MATAMPENTAKLVLDWLANGTAIPAETGREVAIFSTMPSLAGDADDGVEAAARQPLTASAAAGSTGARIAEADMVSPVTFTLLVPSNEVVAIGIADVATGALRALADWRPARQDIPAGGDLLIDAQELELITSRH